MGKKKYNKFDLSGEYGIGYFDNGQSFYFDLEDFEPHIQGKYWRNCKGYAANFFWTRDESGKRKHHMTLLHRTIMGAPDDKDIDHINGNRADSRKHNLRVCESHENDCNRKVQENSVSGVTGVCWVNAINRWRAYITWCNKRIWLGTYEAIEDAIQARYRKERELFGNFSRGVIEGRIT